MPRIDWHPTTRQLRQFGAIALFALPFAGWLWRLNGAVVAGLAATGLLMVLLGWLRPQTLRFPFLGLTLAAMPIGLVVEEVILLLSFFVILTPIGLAFRMLGRDALQRSLDRQAPTYWQPKAAPRGPASYLRQS